MIIISHALKQYPELVNFLQANTEEELLQRQQLLAPSYTGLSYLFEVELTPLEIAALLSKSKQIKFLLSLPSLYIGIYPQLVAKYLHEAMGETQFTNYFVEIAKLFTNAAQFIELNKTSSDAATCLVKQRDACDILTALFKSPEEFIELAQGSSWVSQWMLLNKKCALKIVQLFKTPGEFDQLAPSGGPIACLLNEDRACEQIAGLYCTADEFLALTKNSERLRSASAQLALNKKSTALIANLFSNAEKFIELTQICSLTAQYLSIAESSCVIIASSFKNAEQFSRLVNTRTIAPYYLTHHKESCLIIAKLFTSRTQLLQLDKVIKECPFNCPPDNYSRSLGKFLTPKEKQRFFKATEVSESILDKNNVSSLEF